MGKLCFVMEVVNYQWDLMRKKEIKLFFLMHFARWWEFLCRNRIALYSLQFKRLKFQNIPHFTKVSILMTCTKINSLFVCFFYFIDLRNVLHPSEIIRFDLRFCLTSNQSLILTRLIQDVSEDCFLSKRCSFSALHIFP